MAALLVRPWIPLIAMSNLCWMKKFLGCSSHSQNAFPLPIALENGASLGSPDLAVLGSLAVSQRYAEALKCSSSLVSNVNVRFERNYWLTRGSQWQLLRLYFHVCRMGFTSCVGIFEMLAPGKRTWQLFRRSVSRYRASLRLGCSQKHLASTRDKHGA